MEISYAKLLTESLAFFLDDVSIDIAPHPTSNDKGPTDVEDAVGVPDQITEGRPKTVDTSKRRSSVDNQAARHTSVSGGDITDSVSSSGTPTGDVAEGLDFLAQWIEQITSKVKVVVSGVTVRVSAEVQVNNDVERGSLANDSFLQIQCSSLKWCDETPETSALLTEGPRQPHSVVSGGGRTKSGQHVGGPLLAHKVRSVAFDETESAQCSTIFLCEASVVSCRWHNLRWSLRCSRVIAAGCMTRWSPR